MLNHIGQNLTCSHFVPSVRICVCLFLICLILQCTSATEKSTFTECGGILKEEKGILTSPNFPNKFPTPISCKWVITAPNRKGIALFFTQYYLTEGMTVTEYYLYSREMQIQPKKIADITFNHVNVVTKKPTLVVEFNVQQITNVHLRVEDHFIDVYGFNITYEFINENQDVRNDTCSVSNCSFLGNCYASYGFLKYSCKCFDKFLGDSCQYGPACNPSRNINSCLHGGRCRYYMGSKANTCDCSEGYTGPRCETRSKVSKECSMHGCSQTCRSNDSGVVECACFNGFKMSKDGKNCLDTGRTRFVVSLKLLNFHVPVNQMKKYVQPNNLYRSLKREIKKIFSDLVKVTNLTILDLGSGAVVKFHFFGEKQDSSKAKDILNKVVSQGNLGHHELVKDYVKFEIEPALQLQDLELNKNKPYIIGDNLVMACGAIGSSSMEVNWYKDGALVDVSKAMRHRKIDTVTQEPTNSDQKYYFELLIEKVTFFDAGLFTCKVKDWGVTQNKSIEVNVVKPPQVSVTPKAVTMIEGESITLKCSENVFMKKLSFKYAWSKNGKLLKESGDIEKVADWYPSGSWLHISDVKSSATYACTVNTEGGKTRKNVFVKVISKYGDVKTCPPETSFGIRWSMSSANNYDIQPCPENYIGDVSRLCDLVSKVGPSWTTPDFSKCKSKKFVDIESKFEELRLGYMITRSINILEDLWNLVNNQVVFYPGEGEPLLHMLMEVVEYLETHSEELEDVSKPSQILFDLCEEILSNPVMVQKQEIMVELHKLIKRQASFRTSILAPDYKEQIYRKYLGIESWKISKVSKQGFIYTRMPFKTKKQKPSWYNDTVDLRFNVHFQDSFYGGNQTLDLSMIVYRNLSALFPTRGITRLDNVEREYQIVSKILTVMINMDQYELGLTTESFKKSLKTKIRLQRQLPDLSEVNQTKYNLSCAMADLSGKKWNFIVDHSCQITETGSTHATCTCDKLGTFALLLFFIPVPQNDIVFAQLDNVVYYGSIICLGFTVLTLLILIISYRKFKGPITFLKMQMCVAVIGAEGSILHAVRQSLTEDQFPIIVSLAQFFIIAAFSLHFCIALQIYVDFVKMEHLKYASVKIVIVGWGFPVLIVGATLAAQEMEGFNLKSWWVLVESNYFYGLVVPIIIMTILQCLLHLAVKSEIRKHFHFSPKVKVARKRSRLLTRTWFTLLAMIIMSFSSIMYINFEDDIFKYFFAFCSSILGFVILLCFALKSEEEGLLVSCCKKHEKENMALDAVSRRSSKIEYKGVPEKFPVEISLDDDDIELVKKQNEKLRKIKERMVHDNSYTDTLDMKKQLLERLSNHTGNGHYIPGSLVVADLTPDVIVAEGSYKHSDYGITDDDIHPSRGSDSGSGSPFQLQLLDNSPRSSIYHPRSRGAPSPNPLNILDSTENNVFKCSDSDSYPGDHVSQMRPCPLHSHISNPSSDLSHSDYSESTTSSIDYVKNPEIAPGETMSPYNNPYMTKLLSEHSSSESEEDISEATVKHISKSPSPQKSLTSPSKLQSTKIGRLSDDPAILAYATSPKTRRSSASVRHSATDRNSRSDPSVGPLKNTTAV